MKSPFPGMDPYLERHWGDVHRRLVQYSCDALQPQLPADLRARVEERIYVQSEPERVRQIIPDITLARVYPAASAGSSVLREGDLAVAEPLVFEVHNPPVKEGYIAIQQRSGGTVITVIEFLSPANKIGGVGRDQYLDQQVEVLQSAACLVEIDLVRAGRRMLALPHFEIPVQCRNSYLACISPGWRRKRRELCVLPLRQRLPALPIPLRPADQPVRLELQALVDRVYASGRYDDLDYGAELDPPFTPEDAAWAADLIAAARRP